MAQLIDIKTGYGNEEFEVQYEILSPFGEKENFSDERRREIAGMLNDVDLRMKRCQERLDELNRDIDKLTNHADGLDYTIAVVSGILTGIMDSILVGRLNLDECHEWGKGKVDSFVKKVGGDEDLEKAIRNLEKRTKMFFPSDSNISDFGGARQHHLRDFAHHPTILGLFCSLLTQFTGKCVGTDKMGRIMIIDVEDPSRIGKTIPQKILYGTVFWFLHLVSDMAGSSATPGAGTGLPGPLLSLAKELSSLPFFKNVTIGDIQLSEFLSKLFNGTLFAERDASGKIIKAVPLDFRTALGIAHKQMMPVMINEVIVRTFYMIRRAAQEFRENSVESIHDLKKLDWRKILPFGNRTVERMMTIASGTFMAFDLIDAAVQSAISSKGNALEFAKEMILHVNFVGIGRFAVAIAVDISMEVKLQAKRVERTRAYSEMLHLGSARVYLTEANMWLSAEDAEKATKELVNIIPAVCACVTTYINDMDDCLNSIDTNGINKNNPWVKDLLKW